MKVIKAPDEFKKDLIKYPFSIFLAGSIEMGKAENWQQKTEQFFEHKNVLILNPRRDDWDSSWVQSIENDQFRTQVEWELDAQQSADLNIFYFSPETKSPITLMELGLFGPTKNSVVCCPEGFWRKGNIEIVCHRFNIPLYTDFDLLLEDVKKKYFI